MNRLDVFGLGCLTGHSAYKANSRRKSIKGILATYLRSIILSGLLLSFSGNAFAQQFEEFYVPLPEAEAFEFFDDIDAPGGGAGFTPVLPVITRTDIVIRELGTIVIFDPSADGFETDTTYSVGPFAATTQFWGDSDCSNGFNPNLTACTTDTDDVFSVGEVVVFDETEVVARDFFRVNRTVNITRSLFPTGTGTFLAGAFELFPAAQFGNNYILPIGENTANSLDMFEQVAVTIMASEDNTSVIFDPDGEGGVAALAPVVLNRGESVEFGSGAGAQGSALVISEGATINSGGPVQVNVLTGDVDSTYAVRFFTLFPNALLSNTYYEAVGSTDAADAAVVFLFNPNDSDILVDAFSNASPNAAPTQINVPANASARFEVPAANANGLTGIRFESQGDEVFTAYTVIDDGDQIHDWGHVTTPLRLLGDTIRVGFAPGNNPELDNAVDPLNASPIWVIADVPGEDDTQDIEICVDANGNGGPLTDAVSGNTYDYSVIVQPLDSTRLYSQGTVQANNGLDQTGMLAFACNSVSNEDIADPSLVLLASAWGQDPEFTASGDSGFDVGTTIRTGSSDRLFLGDEIFEDLNGNGSRDAGEPLIPGVNVTISVANLDIDVDRDQPGIQNSLTIRTTANGYLFTGLTSGQNYTVTVTPPDGFDPISDPDGVLDNTTTVNLSASTLAQDFGYNNNVPVGQVGDFVYNDLNGNGIQEAGELGIGGINLELCRTDGGGFNTQILATDEFNNVAYNNNSAQWASDWIEADDDGSPATTRAGNQGIFVTGAGELSIRGNADGPSLTRQIDLTGFTDTALTFGFRGADDAYEAGDQVFVEVSVNGGAFTLLTTILGTDIDNFSGNLTLPFDSQGSNDVQIRFRVNPGNFFGGGENLFIDDLAVVNAPRCQTQTTDANGAYLFENVPTASYEITVLNPPAGLQNTDDPGSAPGSVGDNVNAFDLLDSGGNLEQDFGYFNPSTVIGHVYIDTNGNGVQDLGEPNVSGLNILITDSLGNFQVVVTDSNGDYSAEVPPGVTQVNIDDDDDLVSIAGFPDGPFPADFIQTDGVDPSNVTAVTGITVDAGDDGYFQGNAIGDTVYSEEDGTPGVQGAGDPGIPNILVTLTPPITVDAGNGVGVPLTRRTDANGNYSFAGLPDATYVVTVTPPSGRTQTEDPDGGNDNLSTVSISGGTINNDQDFGYANNVPQGFIGDRVYSDLNGNGIQDPGEPGIPGITVQIAGDLDDDDSTPATVRTEVTDADGDYLFGDLLAADGVTVDNNDTGLPPTTGIELYTVTILNPPAGQLNSQDPDGNLPNFSQLTLGATGGNLDQDFGYFLPGEITGQLYIDSNGNGDQDPGEPNLANVDVVITDVNGNQQTVTTDINGEYSANVPPGDTTVDVDETDAQFPLNHLQTEGDDPTLVTAVAGVSTSAGIDGYAPMGFIGDKVFFDNSVAGTIGVFDPAFDVGIPGIVVTLLPPVGVDLGNGDGQPITQLTDANGNYGFSALAAGTYTVSVTPPSGVTQTIDPNEAGVCVTCDSSSTITIVTGETNSLQDFGYQSNIVPGTCPISTVTFDEYPLASFNSTTIFDTEYVTGGADNTNSPLLPNEGFSITAVNGTGQAVVYNTNTGQVPQGNDTDLEVSNTGNALIVQEGGNTGGVGEGGLIPDDVVGGLLIFDFERPLTEFSATFVDFEGAIASLTFTDTSVTPNISVTIQHFNLVNRGQGIEFPNDPIGDPNGPTNTQFPAITPEFLQSAANCPALGDEEVCVMDNSITALELANFGGVPLARFDRIEYQFQASGAIDNLNFAYNCEAGTIGDQIFNDNNANGIFDAGDTGIPGIDVQICGDLFGNDLTPQPQTCRVETTDANGNYLFGDRLAADGITPDPADVGLPATTGTEDYTITILNPPVGSINTADPDGLTPNVAQLTLPGAFSNLDQDFGYVIRSSLAGSVWLDEDLDGILDIEETGITGTQVELILNGAVVATTVTDANGDYSFLDILPGEYTVNVVDSTLPPSLQNTAGPNGIDPRPVSVAPGQTVEQIDFGYIPLTNTGAIGDRVWFDANANGIQDPGEAGIAGVELTLSNSDGSPVTGVGTVTSNANGDYLFTNVPFGDDYIVSIATNDPALSGFEPTVGPQSEGGFVGNPVSLSATASVVTDIDFGFDADSTNTVNRNTIIDSFWVDSNRDGVRDVAEEPIANVTVTLFNDANSDGIPDDADNNGQPDVVATTISDANGGVSFTGLVDGSYVIAVTDVNSQLINFVGTTGEAARGLSDSVSVTGGQINSQNSFGYNQPGLIAGTVYADPNVSNDQESGEAGFSGVTVTLLLDSNNDGNFDTTVETVQTGADGSYAFNVNDPGQYRIVVTPPGGNQTEDPDGAQDSQTDITLATGQSSVGNDFGYEGVADTFNLSGTVFIDPDKDGIEDAGEPGIEGVTLELIDRNRLDAYDIVNGMVDINNDGRSTGADDGLVNGIAVIDGNFDIDGSGIIDEDDNGVIANNNVLAGMINLAQTGVASQSSNIDAVRLASVANDGNPSGLPATSALAVTNQTSTTEYWQLDLGSVQSIGEITIFNRDDGFQGRLTNVFVLVSDTPFPADTNVTNDVAAARANADFEFQISEASLATNPDPVVDAGGISGRYIRLQKSGNNANGSDLNPNHINIAEVKVTPGRIPASSDGVVASVVTDANGDYSFTGLTNGDYSVAVSDSAIRLAGFDITSGLDVLDRSINGADETDVDFGYIREEATASISGEVFIDENNNGTAQDQEFDLANVRVYLCTSPILSPDAAPCDPGDTGSFVAETRSDVNGEYIFADLLPGQYIVDTDPSDIPAGLNQTVDPATVSLSEGEDVTEVDHGYQPAPTGGGNNAGVLSGFVWIDAVPNGIFDANEAPISGVTINVFRASDAPGSGPVLSTTTRPDGSWIISNIVANLVDDLFVTYQANDDGGINGIDSAAGVDLNETQPTNFPIGDNIYNPVPLLSDEDNNISNLDFGFDPDTANLGSISGSIYTDVDQDGDLDRVNSPSIDTRLRDVTVNLLDGANNVIATTRTDANGDYMFVGLNVGDAITGIDYRVQITDNANLTRDLNPAEVLPAVITLRDIAGSSTDPNPGPGAGARNVVQQDAGFTSDIEFRSIGNRFFFDANRNGIVDDDESGVEGVTVQCWLDVDQSEAPNNATVASSLVVPEPGIDNLIRTVQTDENGEYVCTSLPAGQYIVVVADANGFDEGADGTLVTGNAGDNFAKNWSYALSLEADAANFAADFGVSGNNTLSGTIFIEDENLVEPADGNTTIQPGDLDGVAGGNPDTTVPGAPADDLAALVNIPIDLLIEEADGSFSVVQTTTTGADGSYNFDGLPDGRYQVRVRPAGTGINGYGQTGDPDLALTAVNPTDLVCDSATVSICDDAAGTSVDSVTGDILAIDLDSGNLDTDPVNQTGVDFGYQLEFTTTPVTMSFFSATRSGDTVSFVWETSNEVGHAGFQVFARVEDGWQLLNEDLLVGNISVGSEVETKQYVFEAQTDAKWFALVDVSHTEEVIARGPFEVGQEYGANLGEKDVFDWSLVEGDSVQNLG